MDTVNTTERCDICDLPKATPEQRKAWLEGYRGAEPAFPKFKTGNEYYAEGICISRGSNGSPPGEAPFCQDRAKDWRGLVLLADKMIAATRAREAAEAGVNNAVVSERPNLDGTMRKVEAMKQLGAALEQEEAALVAYEKARVTL